MLVHYEPLKEAKTPTWEPLREVQVAGRSSFRSYDAIKNRRIYYKNYQHFMRTN